MSDIIENNKQIITKITTEVHSNYELQVFKAKSFLKNKKCNNYDNMQFLDSTFIILHCKS